MLAFTLLAIINVLNNDAFDFNSLTFFLCLILSSYSVLAFVVLINIRRGSFHLTYWIYDPIH